MLETGMNFVQSGKQIQRFAVHQQEATGLSCSEKEIFQWGWEVEGAIPYQSCSALAIVCSCWVSNFYIINC